MHLPLLPPYISLTWLELPAPWGICSSKKTVSNSPFFFFFFLFHPTDSLHFYQTIFFSPYLNLLPLLLVLIFPLESHLGSLPTASTCSRAVLSYQADFLLTTSCCGKSCFLLIWMPFHCVHKEHRVPWPSHSEFQLS